MNELKELKSPTTGSSELVAANYNKLSDHIRRLTPQGIQCSVFCGGLNCKYENPENWTSDSLAIQGIYSHWITDNILAMARPSTMIIMKKNVIQQFEREIQYYNLKREMRYEDHFKRLFSGKDQRITRLHYLRIKSIINLQSPREHASCGQPLESSGFSYDPNIFMENKIYYYNFAWKDYGDATLLGLLNMVKVLTFAITEGRVAIHCHAGLGRTGVLLACYLVYSLRVQASDAIRYVRLKRPGSVQTRGQIMCVRHFASFVLPQTATFFIKENEKEKHMTQFTLARFLRRQKVALHGYDERNFKYLPKIVHKICERILKLSGNWIEEFPLSANVPFTIDFMCCTNGTNMRRHDSMYTISTNMSDSTFLSPDMPNSPTSSSSEVLSIPSTPSSPNPSDNADTLSELEDDEEIDEDLLYENRCFQELETQKSFQIENYDEDVEIQDIRKVTSALLIDFTASDSSLRKTVRQLQTSINTSEFGWAKLNLETDLSVLCAMLFDWIESLKSPILSREDMENIVINYKQANICFSKIDILSAYLIEYLLRFLIKIQPISKETQSEILKRFLAAFTQQTVVIGSNNVPAGRNFRKLRDGTFSCAMEFFESLLNILDAQQKFSKTVSIESSKDHSAQNIDNCFQ